MRRLVRILLILILTPAIVAAVIGWLAGPSFLHPQRRELSPELIRESESAFAHLRTHAQEMEVRAADGVLLRGWKVRSHTPNGNWVLVYHGVADNRAGVLVQAQLLLESGYSVVMMDARSHGASEGPIATYGWLERKDSKIIVDALEIAEHPRHVFALGESMGAGIALQSAAVDPRIEAVVAEAPFASLLQAAYDYAGLQRYPLLGMTLLAPGAWAMIYHGQLAAGFPASEVSPEKAVAARPFPILLICDAADNVLPCRHTERIFAAARGPKQLWVVQRAFHTAAIGYEPEEFRRRVLNFYSTYSVN
jgi:alpha-beta hydrolase superfamily lysophospholipase